MMMPTMSLEYLLSISGSLALKLWDIGSIHVMRTTIYLFGKWQDIASSVPAIFHLFRLYKSFLIIEKSCDLYYYPHILIVHL